MRMAEKNVGRCAQIKIAKELAQTYLMRIINI